MNVQTTTGARPRTTTPSANSQNLFCGRFVQEQTTTSPTPALRYLVDYSSVKLAVEAKLERNIRKKKTYTLVGVVAPQVKARQKEKIKKLENKLHAINCLLLTRFGDNMPKLCVKVSLQRFFRGEPGENSHHMYDMLKADLTALASLPRQGNEEEEAQKVAILQAVNNHSSIIATYTNILGAFYENQNQVYLVLASVKHPQYSPEVQISLSPSVCSALSTYSDSLFTPDSGNILQERQARAMVFPPRGEERGGAEPSATRLTEYLPQAPMLQEEQAGAMAFPYQGEERGEAEPPVQDPGEYMPQVHISTHMLLKGKK